jgi:site-specific DNA recombinase
MENAIIYIRVSTADQENSLELQEKSLRQYCQLKNLNVIQAIIDEDVSGFKPLYARKGGSLIPSLLQSAKIVVAMKPDRLFRNVIDSLTTIDQWNKDNIALHIVDMGGAQFRTDTAIGKLMFTTIISFSQFERDITGERVKAISTDKKANGKVYCGELFGFDKVKGELIPNQREQEILSTIKQLSAKFKPTRIARILNNTGHRSKKGLPFRQSTINYIIKNPIYN